MAGQDSVAQSGMNPAAKTAPGVPVDSRQMYIFLLVLAITVAMGFQGWRTLYNNFAVEVIGLTGAQNGYVQSLREVPGFLALLAVYLLLILSEHRLAALSVLVMGIGICLTGFLPSFYGVIFSVLVMSFGFHYYETANQSLALQYFDRTQAPVVLGRLRGVTAGGNLLVGAAIFILSSRLDYATLFCLCGSIALLAGLWAFTKNPAQKGLPPQRKGMVLRSRYWLFYVLTFLSGARRQVFTAFAVFLLVERFGFSVREITILFIINNVVNWFLSPAIGRAVNRFGERRVLSVEYLGLMVVFTAYGLVESKLLVAVLYVLDHIFYNFAIAIKTYFQKIADPADIAPSMAVSFSINHIAAVLIPVMGGLLWMVDYRIPFFAAAGLAFLSFVFSQFVRTPESVRK